jgi:hypothetical protein
MCRFEPAASYALPVPGEFVEHGRNRQFGEKPRNKVNQNTVAAV